MGTPRRYKGSNLFLVRVWVKEQDEADDKADNEWHGMVQRVVNGESHEFKSLQDLVGTLTSMLTNNKGR